MTALLYATEVAVIAAAVLLMLWLRSAGAEAWRQHRIRVLAEPITEAFIQLRLEIADGFTPAMKKVARAANDLAWALSAPTVFSDELVRLTLGGRPDRPELYVNHIDVPGEGTR